MIQTFFFFTMCMMVGAEDDRYSDCSYQWFLVENDIVFDTIFSTDHQKNDPF